MQGHYEDGADVRAQRALREAARRYGAAILAGGMPYEAEAALDKAALAFAATQPRPKP